MIVAVLWLYRRFILFSAVRIYLLIAVVKWFIRRQIVDQSVELSGRWNVYSREENSNSN